MSYEKFKAAPFVRESSEKKKVKKKKAKKKNLPHVCVSRHGIGKTNVVITSTHWNLVVGLVNTSSGYLNWSLKKSTVSQVVMHSLLVISLLSWILCIHVYKSAEILFVLYGWTKAVRGISTAQLCKLSRFRFPNTSKLHWAMCCFPVVLLLLTYKGFSGPDFFRGWVMGQGHPLIPST